MLSSQAESVREGENGCVRSGVRGMQYVCVCVGGDVNV